MTRAYIDVETIGFHGFATLLQYAFDEGDVTLHEIWREPVWKTLELIFKIAECDVVGFNLAFDWFHICKVATTFTQLPMDFIPLDDIERVARAEYAAIHGPCLKPKRALDLMLHVRTGPLQSLMDRKDIIIRCVPDALAEKLRDVLEETIHLDGIYFARKKDKDAPRWTLRPSTNRDRTPMPGFSDVILRFRPSGALKVLAEHLLGWKSTSKFVDVTRNLPKADECGWAPYAKAVGFKKGWPRVARRHIMHWATDDIARKYAEDDVKITRDLDRYCKYPEPGDLESTLACMVAAERWHGFRIRQNRVQQQIDILDSKRDNRIPTAPTRVLPWLQEVLTPMERAVFGRKTDKQTLKEMMSLECPDCDGKDSTDCPTCKGTGKHPVGVRAEKVLQQRSLAKERDVFRKLLQSLRFHPSFKVIGSLSGRMSGADKTHPQGVQHVDTIRDLYELADFDKGYVLCGGDFDSFEVVLAIADYGDARLEADVRAGKKIHALFALKMFPEYTMAEILTSKGTVNDKYTLGKQGVFALTYGGNQSTLVKRHKIPQEIADRAFEGFFADYPGIAAAREQLSQEFTAMRQHESGGAITWTDPSEFVGSMFGYRRYFTLEQKIMRKLFDLAESPPPEWLQLKIRVTRKAHKGVQTVGNATRSALYAAAFGIQSYMVRSALNHRIQASGAKVCKVVQAAIWDIQPAGFNKWIVQPFNVHDELPCPTLAGHEKEVADAVSVAVESFREKVPLIRLDWESNLVSWSKGMNERLAIAVKAAYDSNGNDLEAACAACGIRSTELKAKAREICDGKIWQWLFQKVGSNA